MLPYLYIIKTKLMLSVAYKFEVFSTIIGEILTMYALVLFWVAAYNGKGVIANTSMTQMIDYTILSLLLGIFYNSTVEGQIRESIRKGNVAVDFIKPVGVMGMYFASILQ